MREAVCEACAGVGVNWAPRRYEAEAEDVRVQAERELKGRSGLYQARFLAYRNELLARSWDWDRRRRIILGGTSRLPSHVDVYCL